MTVCTILIVSHIMFCLVSRHLIALFLEYVRFEHGLLKLGYNIASSTSFLSTLIPALYLLT